MIRSLVFVVLAITLFLGGCLCAEETGAPSAVVADEETATEKVTELQALTKEVFEKAETKLRGAQSAKTAAGDQKRKAEMAESAVRTAAAEIKAGNRKEQADVIVRTAAKELGKCNNLYEDANNKAEKASETLNAFVSSARTLDNEAKTKIVPAAGPPDNYAEVIKNAAASKDLTTTLNGEIDASRDLSLAESALLPLKDSAKKVQVFKYQAESLVIAFNIETKMSAAETHIRSIQQYKDKIDAIVKEMKTKFKSAPDSLSSVLSLSYSNAERQLQTASSQVTEANKCKETMLDRKKQLDQTLKTLKARTDEESDAGNDAKGVEGHAKDIDGEIEKIKGALRAAENAFTSAESEQQQMNDEMEKNKSQSVGGLNKRNPQDNVRTEDGTNSIQNSKTKNPATTETDQTALEKSKDTMDKTSAQPVDTHVDKTEQNKSTELTHNEKPNPKDGNSELLNNEKLRNITKDITNNPLIGGEVPKRSAANDSAVTVFIPLLVILVISAVVH